MALPAVPPARESTSTTGLVPEARDVFVSPRVIDRRAFEEYSLTLQQLIREASGHGRTLESTSTEIKLLRDGVQTVSRDLQTRLDAALKVLPSLEQRVTRAEEIAREVTRLTTDPAALAAHIEERLAGLVSSKADEVEAVCRLAVERVHARLEERERQLEQATRDFDAFVTRRLEELERAHSDAASRIELREKEAGDRLVEMQSRHTEALQREELMSLDRLTQRERQAMDAISGHLLEVQDLEARARASLEDSRRLAESEEQAARRRCDELQREATRSLEQIDRAVQSRLDEMAEVMAENERRFEARRQDAAAREAAILDRERQTQQRLDEIVQCMEERLAPLHEQVDRDVRELDKRIRRARVEVEIAGGPGMQRLEQICRAAASLLGPAESVRLGLPPGESSGFPGLGEVVERATRLHDRLVAKGGEFSLLEQQVETARRGIDRAILEGADKIDLVLQQTEALERTIQAARENAREIEQTVDQRIELLRADAQAFHEYTTRLGQHLVQLNENAEKLARELGARFGPDAKPVSLAEPLLQQSHAAADRLADLLDKAGATIRALDAVASSVQPGERKSRRAS